MAQAGPAARLRRPAAAADADVFGVLAADFDDGHIPAPVRVAGDGGRGMGHDFIEDNNSGRMAARVRENGAGQDLPV